MEITRTQHALGAMIIMVSLVGSLACSDDEGEEEGAVDVCTSSYLIAQCPSGSDPVLGAAAETECTAATSNLVTDETGAVTASCAGTTECLVLCQFAEPCLCGVESVTRESITCMKCEEGQGCGDDVCAPGESPETCMIDCGPECMPDEMQCGNEGRLRVCNLQGRFDEISCPAGQTCQELEGGAGCADGVVGPNNSNSNSNNDPELPSGWSLGPASYPGGGSVIGTADMRDLTRALPLPTALTSSPWFDFHPDGASIYRLDTTTWSIERYPVRAVLDGVDGEFGEAEVLIGDEPLDLRLVTFKPAPDHGHLILAGAASTSNSAMVDYRVYVVDVSNASATRLALPAGWLPYPWAQYATFSEDSSTLAALVQFGRVAFSDFPSSLGVAILDLASGEVSILPIAYDMSVNTDQVHLSPNGRLVMVDGDIYDTTSGEVVFTQPRPGALLGADSKKTERRLFLPLADRVFNPRGGVVNMATLTYDESLVITLDDRFAPDGNSVMREGASEVEVWDLAQNRRVNVFPGATILHSFHEDGYALYSNMLLAP